MSEILSLRFRASNLRWVCSSGRPEMLCRYGPVRRLKCEHRAPESGYKIRNSASFVRQDFGLARVAAMGDRTVLSSARPESPG